VFRVDETLQCVCEKSTTTEWNVYNDIILFLLEHGADKSNIPEELYNYITRANDTKPVM